jgi:hypothetical protein
MNNNVLQLKIKQRLNKLASNDYDNIECWQIVEAFNKGMTDWCRRNLHGLNVVKEGDEQSKRRIDDLQILLIDTTVPVSNVQIYYETLGSLPADYFEWKRIMVMATSECCPKPKRMVVYQAEDANVPTLLRDNNKKPSFDWGETFCTLKNNKVQIYTNGEFEIGDAVLTYYRQPRKIQILNCVDPYTGVTSTVDVECEFKDDLVELFIDEAAKIIAGDIEAMNQYQRASQSVEGNN